MGSEVPSTDYFLRGAAPKKIVQSKEPKAHRFNWCLEQRNDIFVLYPSSIYGTFQSFSYFLLFVLIILILVQNDVHRATGQYAALR